MLRRIASNRIVIDNRQLTLHVIEIEDGFVKDFYPLTQELPFTEWFNGTITLTKDKNGKTIAVKDGMILK